MKFQEVNQKVFEALQEKNIVGLSMLREAFEVCQQKDKHLGLYILEKGWVEPEMMSNILDKVAKKLENYLQGMQQIPPLEGKEIDGFLIEKEIARGGMGVVYLATQKDIKRKVALKLMLKDAMSDKRERKRFLKEAELTSRLNHPNIIPVYRVGFYKKQYPYFVMKFVPGVTLDKFLEVNDVSLEEKITILIQICHAVEHAHQRNILHRDLKPSNVIIGDDGCTYLMDFGIAKDLNSRTRLTQTGGVVGTVYYMSPEQVQNQKLHYTTDVYSLGVMFYQMLTDSLPSVGNSVIEICESIVNENPAWPSELDNQLPIELDAICRRAMAKSTMHRYSRATNLVDDLEKFTRGEQVSSLFFRFWSRFLPDRLASGKNFAIIFIIALLFATAYYNYIFRSKSAREYWQEAQHSYQQTDYTSALTSLEALIQKRPNFLPAQILQGQIYYQQKKKTSLRTTWNPLLPKLEDFDTLKKIATQALAMEMLEEAQGYAEKALLFKKESEIARILQKVYLLRSQLADLDKLYRKFDLQKYPEFHLEKLWREKKWKTLQEKLQEPSSKSLLTSQTLFWQSTANWLSQADLFNHVEWLFDSQNESLLQKNLLTTTIQTLEQAQSQTQEIASPLWQKYWRTLIQTYLHAAHLEASNPNFATAIPSFTNRPLAEQSFLSSVIIRYHLKKSDYSLALKIAEENVKTFPWSSSLRSLKSLALTQCNQVEKAMLEIRRCLKINPLRVNPLINFFSIAAENPSLERIRTFSTLALDKRVSFFPLYRLFLQKQIDVLQESYRSRNRVMPLTPAQEDFFLNTLFTSKSEQAKTLALRKLLEPIGGDHLQFQQQVRRIEKNYSPKKYPAIWQKINTVFQQNRQQFQQEKLRYLLVKYSVLEEKSYVQDIQEMGKEGEKLLWQIIHENPMGIWRLIAARVLVAYRHDYIITKMQNLAESNTFPANIIAMTALKEKKLVVLQPQVTRIMSKLQFEKDTFYHTLAALHVNPFENKWAMIDFLKSPSPLVVLAASYNLRLYATPPVGISLDQINKQIAQLFLTSSDIQIKSIALGILWQVADAPNEPDKREGILQERWQRNYLRGVLWEKHAQTMMKALSDSNESIRLAACCIITSNYIGFRELFNRQKKKSKKLRKLLQQGLNKSIEEQYWSVNALGIVGTVPIMTDIFSDKSKASLSGASFTYTIARSNTRTLINLFPIAKKLMLASVETEQDKKSIKTLVFSLAYFYPLLTANAGQINDSYRQRQIILLSLYGKMKEEFYKLYANSENEEILNTFLMSMTWHGQKTDLKIINQQLAKQFSFPMQKAAWRTAQGAIASREMSDLELRQMMKQNQNWSAEAKQAFGWGITQGIRDKILSDNDWLHNLEIIHDQDRYLQVFAKHATISMANKLLLAANWDEKSIYYYLAALVYQRENNPLANKQVEKALQIYYREKQSDKKLLARYLTLRAQLTTQDNQTILLKRARDNYLAYSDIYRVKGEQLLLENRLDEAEKMFWQAYLYGADNKKGKQYIRRLILHFYRNKQYQKAVDILTRYHSHVYTFYRDEIQRDFPDLLRGKWGDQFPKRQ